MFNISFEINGRRVAPGGIASALEQALVGKIQDNIASRLRDVGPTPSGQFLKVTLKGTRLDNLSVELNGPEELVAEARKRLQY